MLAVLCNFLRQAGNWLGRTKYNEVGNVSEKGTRLPPEDEEILDITTVCGHSIVSFNLVRRMATEVSKGMISLEEAGRIMARPCSCGIFNPKRAEDLLRQYIATGLGEERSR